jgi:outer membrane protein
VNVLANNDYYKFKNVGDIADFELSSFGNRFSHDTDKKTLSIGVIGEILGPSFQFTTGNRLGFGFSSRARIFGQGYDVNTAFLDVINQNYTTPISFRDNNTFSLNISGFTDLGVKGAYTVLDNDAVSLSLGAALKLYRGGVYNSFVSKGYNINYNPHVPSTPLSINNVNWEFYTNFDVPVTASDAERQKDRRVEVKFVEGAEWEALKKSDVPVAAKKAVKKGKAPVRKASAKKAPAKKK